MKTQSSNKSLVIGVGSSFCCDESVGISLSKRLENFIHNKPHLFKAQIINVTECTGDADSLIDVWQGYDRVFIVYTIHGLTKPGRTHCVYADEHPLNFALFKNSIQAHGVFTAVETARVLGKLPSHVCIYGVEGENFNFGESISRTVYLASNYIFQKILLELIYTSQADRVLTPLFDMKSEFDVLH